MYLPTYIYEKERQGPDRAVGPILVVRSATLVRSAFGVSFFLRFFRIL